MTDRAVGPPTRDAIRAVAIVLGSALACACGTEPGGGDSGAALDAAGIDAPSDGAPDHDALPSDAAAIDDAAEPDAGPPVERGLDPGFGTGGIARAPIEPSDVLVDAEDRIWLVGTDRAALALARLLPDGSADGSFGTAGVVRIEPDPEHSLGGLHLARSADALYATGADTGLRTGTISPLLVAFDTAGAPLASFGTGGVQSVPGITTFLTGIAVPAPGTILVGLPSPAASVSIRDATGTETARTMLVHQAESVTLDGDGALVSAASASGVQVTRLRGDGTIDDAFGDAGVATFAGLAGAGIRYARAVRCGARVYAEVALFSPDATTSDFVLVRFSGDGDPDPTFGSGGTVVIDVETIDVPLDFECIGATLLVAGWVESASSREAVVLARSLDGAPSATFPGGELRVPSPSLGPSVRAIAPAPDGGLVGLLAPGPGVFRVR